MVKKYDKIYRIDYNENNSFQPDELVYVEEKIDGCFRHDMKVHTNKGMIEIGKIVNQELDVKVLSMDENNNKSYKKITKYYKHDKTTNWKKLSYDYFGKEKFIIVTDNHKIFTNNGLKQVKDLTNEDMLISDKLKLNQTQREIIFGSILGDGSFRNMNLPQNPMFSETHGIKQKKYLKWKKDVFGELCTYEEYSKSRFDENCLYTEKYRIQTKSSIVFKEFSFMYQKGKKKIPLHGLREYLTPLALAVWFMDDGSSHFSTKQKPRAKFHTQSFSEEEVRYLRTLLRINFDINSKQHNYKGWQIDLTTESTAKLYSVISPYIVECMQYKLPKEFQVIPESLLMDKSPLTCEITSISNYDGKGSKRYDLEIESNHNYFVKGLQVHNSNFRVWVDEDLQIRFGSRNIEFPLEDSDEFEGYGAFTEAVEYIKLMPSPMYHKDYIYYFEAMIKHSLNYEYDKHPKAVLFDIYCISQDRYLPRDILEGYSDNLEITPKLFEGEYKDFNQEIPQSKYGNFQAEGFVIKPVVSSRDVYGNIHRAKVVAEKFKEQHRETFGDANDKESAFAMKYTTFGRIDKEIHKLETIKNEKVKPEWIGFLTYNLTKDICNEEFKKLLKIDTPNLRTIQKEVQRQLKLRLQQLKVI